MLLLFYYLIHKDVWVYVVPRWRGGWGYHVNFRVREHQKGLPYCISDMAQGENIRYKTHQQAFIAGVWCAFKEYRKRRNKQKA